MVTQGAGLRRAPLLVQCSAASTLTLTSFGTRGPVFSFCSGLCKLYVASVDKLSACLGLSRGFEAEGEPWEAEGCCG